jgi:hypothetical protein
LLFPPVLLRARSRVFPSTAPEEEIIRRNYEQMCIEWSISPDLYRDVVLSF